MSLQHHTRRPSDAAAALPPRPNTSSDTAVGKELGAIGVALGMAADPLDAALDEVFPDTTVALISRWEKVCRIAVRVGDDIQTRRNRVLAVLRRLSGQPWISWARCSRRSWRRRRTS